MLTRTKYVLTAISFHFLKLNEIQGLIIKYDILGVKIEFPLVSALDSIVYKYGGESMNISDTPDTILNYFTPSGPGVSQQCLEGKSIKYLILQINIFKNFKKQ